MSFTCPFCYQEHDQNECPMKCSTVMRYGKCPEGVCTDADGWVDKKSYKKCMKCTKARKDFYCPVSLEKKDDFPFPMVVPMRCIATTGMPIALVGAKASGKSNYIGVLVDQIRKKMTLPFNCAIMMNCDPTSKSLYDDNYARPLFKEKMQITTTDGGKTPPMIFPIDFNNKHVVFTIYDTAGENFDSIESIESYTDYLINAKAIIALIDPLQLDYIRERAEGIIPLPEKNRDATDIIDKIITVIENHTNNLKVFDKSLAIVFTKMDALERLNADDVLPANSCLRDDSVYSDRGVFVRSEFETTQLAIADLRDTFLNDASSDLESKLRRFKQVAYFGVSALGCIPNGDGTLGDGGVRPKRVLDPLLWILAEHGFIKTAKR